MLQCYIDTTEAYDSGVLNSAPVHLYKFVTEFNVLSFDLYRAFHNVLRDYKHL